MFKSLSRQAILFGVMTLMLLGIFGTVKTVESAHHLAALHAAPVACGTGGEPPCN